MGTPTTGRFWEQALRGSRWLVDHLDVDGNWKGLSEPKIDAFYKGSWALAITGQAVAAQRLLNYVQRHFLTPDGDFLPRNNAYLVDVIYQYANAYFVVGSIVNGRYGIAMPAVHFLLSQQNPGHGGFYTRRMKPGEKTLSDTVCTSAGGMACLAAGQITAARRAADNLSLTMDSQPEPADHFFTTMDPDGRLIINDTARYRVIDAHTTNQMWFSLGLPFAFAIQLAEATGEAHYRDLAERYLAYQEQCVDPWDGNSSGKAGWGCAMLYRITGEKRYRDIALYVANQIAAKQDRDGSWLSFRAEGYGPGDQIPITHAGLDVSSEYTLWLGLIASHVLARDVDG